MKLRSVFVSLLAVIGLSSCSFYSSAYRPVTSRPQGNWEGSRWSGYTEQAHGGGKYTIGYEAYNKPSLATARYFVMVRAAERAAMDGQRHFYLGKEKIEQGQQQSRFAGYVEPGYDVTHVEEHDHVDAHGHVVHHVIETTERVPDRYVPPRSVLNNITKVSRKLSYSGAESQKFDTVLSLQEADANALKLGRPKLNPLAKQQLELWGVKLK